MATTLPPAGWYHDPAARFEYRYWNGDAWTDHVRSDGVVGVDDDLTAPGGQVVESSFEDLLVEPVAVEEVAIEEVAVEPIAVDEAEPTVAELGRGPGWSLPVLAVVGGGAVLLAVGALLPWAEAESARASFSETGLDGNGAITLLAGIVVVLVITLMRRSTRAAGCVLALATAALAVGIYEAVDTSRKANDLLAHSSPDVSAGVGVGVWVTIGAAVIVLVGGTIALLSVKRA